MENASKALIIAGAILLSILIIGLGMMIFNQAKDAMSNSGLDAQAIETYNNDFMPYIGTRITGTNLRALIGVVKNHNLAEIRNGGDITKDANAEDTKFVTIGGKVTATDLDSLRSAIPTGGTYTVEVEKYNSDGLICKIKYTKNP